MNRSLRAWCCITGLSATASIAAAAQAAPPALHLAQIQAVSAFDLPAQTLVESLHAIGKLTGINILIDLKMLAGLQAPALKDDLTASQAIARVLSGTDIHYRFIDERTVVLSKDNASSRPEPNTDPSGQAPAPQSLAPQAQASPRTAGESTLEEIVVTAQKREERLRDVPISIVALTSEELQKRQINNIDELSFAVPGLFVASSGSFQREISIRGVSNVFGNSSLIGLYLDEMSVTSAPCCQIDLPTYDLERVEVLRGPQGTLYGEGSAGGTIRFITKSPVLNGFSFDSDVATLFTQDGAPSQRVREVINVPLLDNELGLRVAGTFDHEGGWVDQPGTSLKNINDQNLVDLRIKGLWKPSAQLTASAMAVIHRNDAPPTAGEDANGNYTQAFNLMTTPAGKDDYEIYNLTLTYDLEKFRILSTTGYLNEDKVIKNLGRQFPAADPATTPIANVYYPEYAPSADVENEELRLTSLGSGGWQWTIGGFYRRARSRLDLPGYYFGEPVTPGASLPGPYVYHTDNVSRSWSAFGDTSYKLTDRLTLGAGLRYFVDDQNSKVSFTNALEGPLQSGKFSASTPRVYAQYGLTGQINIYTSAARGFRSGGFNAPGQPTYGPEDVWTYELGTKMAVLDNRLSADIALFYSNYTNYQVTGLVMLPSGQPVNVMSNAGNARIKGIEWGLTWHPAQRWTVSVNGDYDKSYFYKINSLLNPDGTPSSPHIGGDPLDYTPKYRYTLSAQRDFGWRGKPGFARLDYNEQGRAFYKQRNEGPWFQDESDIIRMLNLNTGLQWTDSLSLGLFAQNLLNDRGYVTPDHIESVAPRSRPRTFGVQFGVKFD